MNISISRESEVDMNEVAAFLYKMKRAELDIRGLALEDLEDRLENDWSPFGCITARSGEELAGCVLLYRLGNSDLIEINPGSLLGSHPIVASGFDSQAVGAELIEAAKYYLVQEGFNAVYIDIPWDPTGPQDAYDRYRERYAQLGFEVIQQVRQMNVSLPAETPAIPPPPDILLSQILCLDEDELYQCHYAAYMNGQAQYFYQMDDQERRADFERIFSPNTKGSPASLAITHDGRVIGYCLLFSEGDFSELMSLAIHPDYRRRGLGIFLLGACMGRAAQQGHTTMHLIVDVKNVGAAELYRKCGFRDVGGNMTFKWKA